MLSTSAGLAWPSSPGVYKAKPRPKSQQLYLFFTFIKFKYYDHYYLYHFYFNFHFTFYHHKAWYLPYLTSISRWTWEFHKGTYFTRCTSIVVARRGEHNIQVYLFCSSKGHFMNRTGSKVMIVLVFTENNKNKGPFSSKKVIFSTKIVLALGIRSNKKVPRQPSKIWTLSTRKNRFALWATSAATGRFHQSYPLPLTNPPCKVPVSATTSSEKPCKRMEPN